MRESTLALARFALVSIWLLRAAAVQAQVSCVTPDDFCVGDPCTIAHPVTVVPSCVVDFGARTLVIAAPVHLPNDGMLSFTAAAIDGFADIDGRHLDAGMGSGGEVELHATAGDVTLRGAIDVSGTLDAGSIVVTASGDILLDDRLDAKAVGFSAAGPGGDVSLAAGGTVTLATASFIDVRSSNEGTPGGTVVLQGDAGVETRGKIDASGSVGGDVDITSSGGPVTVRQSLRARGDTGLGGNISLTAADTVAVTRRPVDVSGTSGGQMSFSSSGGDVVIAPNVTAHGSSTGGTITVSAFGSFIVDRRLDARGGAFGGTVALTAQTLQVLDRVRVSAAQQGGSIVLTGGTVSFDRGRLEAQGGVLGGASGGSIDITASVLVDFARGTADAGGSQAGAIFIQGAAVNVGSSADLDADSVPSGGGGVLCLKATAGNMVLDGDFNARKGGVIEANASADLTASGDFRADPGGCIGLTAGGTLSTAGSSFNPAAGPSCGVCP